MFVFRRDPDAALGIGVAFTSARLDLGDHQGAAPRAAAFDVLGAALGIPVAAVQQVHGRDVVRAEVVAGASGVVDLTAERADAIVTTQAGLGIAVRVADCLPICLAAVDGSAVAAVHAGRDGLLEGVIGAAVAALREHTSAGLVSWVGPHICGACYEVPADMASDAAARLGVPRATTSWGTPAIDLGAAAVAQLVDAGVPVEVVGGCTLHATGSHSHRGGSTGRQVGVVWIGARGASHDPGVPRWGDLPTALG